MEVPPPAPERGGEKELETAAAQWGGRGFLFREGRFMVVIMKPDFTPEQLQEAIQAMKAGGVQVNISKGAETTVLGAEGNTAGIDQELLEQLPGVEKVMRVTEPYKKANRKFHG